MLAGRNILSRDGRWLLFRCIEDPAYNGYRLFFAPVGNSGRACIDLSAYQYNLLPLVEQERIAPAILNILRQNEANFLNFRENDWAHCGLVGS
jgi:hypothetical protein